MKSREMKIGDTFTNAFGMQFTYIPAGRFMMGDLDGFHAADELIGYHSQRSVTITKPFMMMTTPVTQRQWLEVMKYLPEFHCDDDLPVGNVTWYEAVVFCGMLRRTELYHDNPFLEAGMASSIHPGHSASARLLTERRDYTRYRLPTEAEWEYACRAGTTTPFNNGKAVLSKDDAACINHNATVDESCNLKPVPVGQYPPNLFGLYDMHGLVNEWCHDWHDISDGSCIAHVMRTLLHYPPIHTLIDPQGPEHGTMRVMRGGSCADSYRACSSCSRTQHCPEYIGAGFRIVMDIE